MAFSYVKGKVAQAQKFQGSKKASIGSIALEATGTIINGLLGWIPGVGMIGGAMKMASKMLDPPTKLSDLKNQKSEIEKST